MASDTDLWRASSILNGRGEGATYVGISADGNSRQHNGDVINNITYTYTLRQRRSDEILRESVRDDEILKAAAKGHTARLRHLVALGVTRDFADDEGLTALHHAALSGYEDTTDALVQAGWYVNSESQCGTPLTMSAYKARVSVVKKLLSHRADVRPLSRILGSALHAACFGGSVAVAQCLGEHGAHIEQLRGIPQPLLLGESNNFVRISAELPTLDVGQPRLGNDNNGPVPVTPLAIASCYGHTEAIEFLHSHGAAVDGPDPVTAMPRQAASDYPPIVLSALKGHKEALDLLFRLGARIDGRYHDGWTVLMVVVAFGRQETTISLIDKGAHIDSVDYEGWTPLMLAAHHGEQNMVRLLLQHGADTERRSETGETATLLAARNGQDECLLALLDHGANPHAQRWDRATLLHLAAAECKPETVKRLLEQGHIVDVLDTEARTPLHYAAGHGNTQVVETLCLAGAKVDANDFQKKTALMHAANKGHTQSVRRLLQLGAHVSAKDEGGDTALHFAAMQGWTETMEVLLEASAELDAENVGDNTPLISAARSGHANAIEVLLRHKAKVNKQDNFGRTALSIASVFGHVECIDSLVRGGADVNARDLTGATPLYAAAREGHTCAIERLLLARPEPLPNHEDTSPVTAAAMWGHLDALKVLLNPKHHLNWTEQNLVQVARNAAYYGHLPVVQYLVNEKGTPWSNALEHAENGLRNGKSGAAEVCSWLKSLPEYTSSWKQSIQRRK